MEKNKWDSDNFFKSREYFEEVLRRMIDIILMRLRVPGGKFPSSPFSYQHVQKRFYICNSPLECYCKKCSKKRRDEEEEKERREEQERMRINLNENNHNSSAEIEEEIKRRLADIESFRKSKEGKYKHSMQRK